jgi:hypothetical protein
MSVPVPANLPDQRQTDPAGSPPNPDRERAHPKDETQGHYQKDEKHPPLPKAAASHHKPETGGV